MQQIWTTAPRGLSQRLAPPLISGARLLAHMWRHPRNALLMALLVYSFVAIGTMSITQAEQPLAYAYLADAFAHGSLALRTPPEQLTGVLSYAGNSYIAHGPLPALLLVPMVLIVGVDGSASLLVLLLGAVNVGLTTLVLQAASQAGVLRLNRLRQGLLILFFATGSVQLVAATVGASTTIEALAAYSCVALGYLAALRLSGVRAFLALGLAIAAALLTRWPAALALIWPLVWLWRSEQRAQRSPLPGVLLLLLPLLAGAAGMGWYNWARFGSPFESGLRYFAHQGVAAFFQQQGVFAPAALLKNLPLLLFAHPLVGGSTSYGLLVLSPLFLVAFMARREQHTMLPLLAITIVFSALPGLLTNVLAPQLVGLAALDFMLPLLLLTALGQRYTPAWLVASLVLLSMAHYLVVTMLR